MKPRPDKKKKQNNLWGKLFLHIILLFLLCAALACIVAAIFYALSELRRDKVKNPQTYRIPRVIDLQKRAKPIPVRTTIPKQPTCDEQKTHGVGSCMVGLAFQQANYCIQYSCGFTIYSAKLECLAQSGNNSLVSATSEYSPDDCPTEGLIGTCTFIKGTSKVYRIKYYNAHLKSTVQQFCQSSNGSWSE